MRRKSDIESAEETSPQICELDIIVKAQKAKIAFSVVAFTVVEVVICLFSIDKLVSGWREDGEKVTNAGGRSVLMLEKAVIKTDSKEEKAGNGDDDDIDSGIIEVRKTLYPLYYVVCYQRRKISIQFGVSKERKSFLVRMEN